VRSRICRKESKGQEEDSTVRSETSVLSVSEPPSVPNVRNEVENEDGRYVDGRIDACSAGPHLQAGRERSDLVSLQGGKRCQRM
jgi:hypothetical protein